DADRRDVRVRARRRLRSLDLRLCVGDRRAELRGVVALRLDQEEVTARERDEQAEDGGDRELRLRERAPLHGESACRRSALISNCTTDREATSVSLLETSRTLSSSGITPR